MSTEKSDAIKKRILNGLCASSPTRTYYLSSIGLMAFPDSPRHRTAQGLALAVSKYVHHLFKSGMIAYGSGNYGGYYLTQKGREAAENCELK